MQGTAVCGAQHSNSPPPRLQRTTAGWWLGVQGASPGAAAGAPWPPRVASCKIARTVLMDRIEFFRVFFWSVLNLFLGQSDFGMVAALKLDPFCVPI